MFRRNKKGRKMIYKGTIEKVFFSGGKWSSVLIVMKDGKKEETITAAGAIAYPVKGYEIEIVGIIENNPKYGPQIKVESSKMSQPKSASGIKELLQSGFIKGIGPSMAEKIYAKFGKKSLKILKEDPDQLLSINGIGKKSLVKIKESCEDAFLYEEVYNELGGYITQLQAVKIKNKYGAHSLKKIKENPYMLMYDIDGIGFLKADAIAQSMGIAPNSLNRVGAALNYILDEMSQTEGHVYADMEMLQNRSLNLLCPFPTIFNDKRQQKSIETKAKENLENWSDIRKETIKEYDLKNDSVKKIDSWFDSIDEFLNLISEAILQEIDAKRIVYDEGTDELNGERIYSTKLFDSENMIANYVAEMINKPPIKRFSLDEINAKLIDSQRAGVKLGEDQTNAIKTSLTNRLSIITGGPGRGKTTVIKTILDIWNDDKHVILCAPTGKASQRMKESTGRDASTIHRKMIEHERKKDLKTDELKEFHYPKNHLIIIDESSMLDISLAYTVFRYSHNNQLIFVGDVDQLPSVGPGSFFRDLINSKMIPTTVLKECFRNSGSIASNSSLINDGNSFKHLTFDNAFTFTPSLKEDIQKNVLDEYLKLAQTYKIKDICVIAPMRQRSQSAVNTLNELIRNAVNPYRSKNPSINSIKFRLHDRIMCLSNNAEKEVYKDGNKELGVFNGDCGEIIDINPNENEITVLFDDDRIATFAPYEMEVFTLAYAITIHKAQGSEYKAVIIPMNKEHFIMLARNLLYTAVTRAKEKVCLIGEKSAFDMAIRNTDYKFRNTMLRQRIVKAIMDKKSSS